MMSNLFPNSPILADAPKQQHPVSKATKKKKAHRRRQQRKLKEADDEKGDLLTIGGAKRKGIQASTKKKRRADMKKYKALVKEIKMQNASDNKGNKKKKQKKKKEEKNVNNKEEILPEELAYKKSLRLNRKEHAKVSEALLSRQATHTLLVKKVDSLRKEAADKRRFLLIHGPLPEERAYRLSIGQQPDACLEI